MTGMQNEINSYNRQNLITELNNYCPSSDEEKFVPQFLELLKIENCFYRDCFPAHITGSALLINQSGTEILMNHHRGLNKWLSFGGHADGDEDILSVAIRETMEESGLTLFKPISSDIFDLDIHGIPENSKKGEPTHFHYDVRYVMQMTDNQNPVISNESVELKWMNFDEALSVIETKDGMHRMINKLKAKIS